jgi:cation diffusion facilitator family transporter
MAHAHSHAVTDAGVAHLHTDDGFRVALIATAGLLLTGGIELAIFAVFARSAGLLADAFHNLGDVSTTVVIAVAFLFSRRAVSDRYPFGLHRAEDIAGLFVLLVMAVSAAVAGWISVDHLLTGHRPQNIGIAMVAALIGAAGNEAVAQYKIREGRRLRSVSLVADGHHSRQDGLVSLAAFAGLAGAAAGWAWADGVAGLVITAVIVAVLIATARTVLGRALDEADPALIRRITTLSDAVPGVEGVHDVRARWSGRTLWVALNIELPAEMTLADAHAVAEQVRHTLLHEVEGVQAVDVHMDPGPDHTSRHIETAHHFGGEPIAVSHDDHDHGDHDHGHDPHHEPRHATDAARPGTQQP